MSPRIKTYLVVFAIALLAIWASRRFGFLSSVTAA